MSTIKARLRQALFVALRTGFRVLRAAINSFANDGLAQLGPTLTELRGLIRDLRRVSDRLDNNPARYLLGRDAPKEFEPK